MQIVPIKSTLTELVKRLEQKNGRSYTIEEIARGANISRQTVKSWLDNNVQATYFATIGGLLAYLRNQGLEVELADLLQEDREAGKVEQASLDDAPAPTA